MDEKEIIKLQQLALELDPDSEQRRQLRDHVLGFTERFLDSLATRSTYDHDDNGRRLGQAEMPEAGRSIQELCQLFEDELVQSHINPASPRFFGYIPGGGLYVSALGDYIAAVTNRYAGVSFASPAAVRIENALIDWACRLFGYTSKGGGTLTSGGSIANLTAVITAREQLDFAQRSQAVVYVSDQAHHSVAKALHLSGMGHAHRHVIAVDDKFRMRSDLLEQAILDDLSGGRIPWLVVSAAGTTNTGAIDPLSKIGDLAAKHGLWHHVDAAYGGFFSLCSDGEDLLSGIANSDSITIDPHKGLFLPYGCGCLLVRDYAALEKAHAYGAAYLQDFADEDRSPDRVSPEMTRHFRSLRLWLPLQVHGLGAFRAALDEKRLLAQWFHQKIALESGFAVGPEPELSVCCFRYQCFDDASQERVSASNSFNRQLTKAVQEQGVVFVSSTDLEGVTWIRLAVLVFRSHLEHVSEALKVILEMAHRLDEKTIIEVIEKKH